MWQKYGLVALLLGILVACGGGGSSTDNSATSAGTGSSSGSSSSSSSSSSGGTSLCTAASFMGQNLLLVGAQMEDTTASAAPFDVRYRYLAGGIRPAGTCSSSCSSSCSNWWGCWQDMSKAPGQYVLSHIQNSAGMTWQGNARAQIPAITYYELLQSSKLAEGTAEVAAINDAAFLTRYLDDWRFLLQTIGNNKAMLHIEPDFWGYVRQLNTDPHKVPAKVQTANPTDCGSQENSASGFAKCMIAMTRKYAPNASVGLHASPWNYTVSGDGAAISTFLTALGAGDGDFVVTDPSDRDAGYYESLNRNTWWDDTAAANYLAWSKTISDTVGKPTVMWQIPLGNMSQNNTANHWKDNRVDYLFAHLPQVAKAKVVALLFGAGEGQQTTPESDGGNLIAKTKSNWQAGGTQLCQ